MLAGSAPGDVESQWHRESADNLTWELPGTLHCLEHAEQTRCIHAPLGAGTIFPGRRTSMERLYDRVAGLDVHKQTVAVCVRTPGPRGAREQQVRVFGTTTVEVLALRDWLQAHGVTHVAMESTGVYDELSSKDRPLPVREERKTCIALVVVCTTCSGPLTRRRTGRDNTKVLNASPVSASARI